MSGPQLTLRDLLYRRCYLQGTRVWQHEVAAEAGVDPSVLSRIVSGNYEVKPEHFDGLRKALRCTDQELLAALPADFSVLHNIYKNSLNDHCSRDNKRALKNNGSRARACGPRVKGRK